METFLKSVAKDLINKNGCNLSKYCIVFPNKRARLFMDDYLLESSDSSIWAPSYKTIQELFTSLSSYTLCDNIHAIFELYKIYEKNVSEHESADKFYGWGEVIINDFDDIDKHCAEANKLFCNIRDIKTLDDYSFLTEEQIQVLQQVFKDFSVDNNTKMKERFLELWNVMDAIYEELNETLRKQGVLYEGALYRDVVDNLDKITKLTDDDITYIFVGFNVLDTVEENLLKHLNKIGKAKFYWDYDSYYIGEKSLLEAGFFLKSNLKTFANELDASFFDNFSKPKTIHLIAATSETAQAKYIPNWLAMNKTEVENQTAMVLCNEHLLQTVLHSIPNKENGGNIDNVNITMGYPFKDTPIYSLLSALIQLQVKGYDDKHQSFSYHFTRVVAEHPYCKYLQQSDYLIQTKDSYQLLTYLIAISEQLARGIATEDKSEIFVPLYCEAIFQTHCTLNRFANLGEDEIIKLSKGTLAKIIDQALSAVSIPFHGEPVTGVQIMGVLETRNLDFTNVLMLSVNEGLLPQSTNTPSLIPYNLREPFGLTTIKHRTSVFAYYFYKILSRASNITLIYNTATEGSKTKEMSRFIYQILAETSFDIKTYELQSEQAIESELPIWVPKSKAILKILQNRYDERIENSKPLSPSALNTFIDCSLAFYFKYIAHIKTPDNDVDEMDAATFGSIFHKAAELIYGDCKKFPITTRVIDSLIGQDGLALNKYIMSAFKSEYFKKSHSKSEDLEGVALIAYDAIKTYLIQLLNVDRKYAPFIIKETEQKVQLTLPVEIAEGILRIKIGGTIDRMDYLQTEGQPDVLRIVDYKTGGKPDEIQSIDDLINPSKKRSNYGFQTFLYALIMMNKEKNPIKPTLLYVNKASSKSLDNFSTDIILAKEPVEDFRIIADDFKKVLIQSIKNLFDSEKPFAQTDVIENCKYCDFRLICKRN